MTEYEQVIELRERLQALQELRKADAAQRNQDAEREALLVAKGRASEELAAAGVPGPMLRAAVALLSEEGHLALDETGRVVWRDHVGDELGLRTGILAWLRREGRDYLEGQPPPPMPEPDATDKASQRKKLGRLLMGIAGQVRE